jgi:hypothetical protein
MTRAFVLATVLFACAGSVASAQESASSATRVDDEVEKTSTWNLWNDLLVTSNQISFNQGSRGVWYFLQSRTFAHDVLTYKFLPEFRSPCRAQPAGVEALVDGVSCWVNADVDVVGNNAPIVALNATTTTQFLIPFGIPPRSLFMHPGIDRLAIIGWKSPVNGRVMVTGSFADIDSSCDNGVLWFIDKGGTTVRAGDLANGGSERFHFRVSIKTNEMLYFIVDPKNGDYACDSTALDLTITNTR